MSQILVVGSLAYDSIQTPFGKVDKALGGSANYFSLSASLFAKVNVIGVVGSDYSDSDKSLLTSRGVDLSGLEVAQGQTFHWSGFYEGDMNEAKTLETHLNVFASFNPKLNSQHQNSEFVFLANIAPELQLSVLNQVKNPLFVGMDTMNFWIQSKKSELKKVVEKVNVILINETEAKMLTDERSGVLAAKKLVEMGPEFVILKRGEYGFMMYSKSNGFFMLPAFPVTNVVDPTGAGDSFAGAVFGYLAAQGRKPTDQDVRRACLYGVVVSSQTIQDFSVKALSEFNKDKLEQRYVDYLKAVTL